jgi:hypothetical protein
MILDSNGNGTAVAVRRYRMTFRSCLIAISLWGPPGGRSASVESACWINGISYPAVRFRVDRGFMSQAEFSFDGSATGW